MKVVVEKIKTLILSSVASFENLVFYETMWKNIGEPGRPRDNMAH
jgi:hypothetical protein